MKNLNDLNMYFEDRSTVSGTAISEADVDLYDSLYETFRCMSFAEKEKFINVSRLFSFVQGIHEVRKNRDKLIFSKTNLY